MDTLVLANNYAPLGRVSWRKAVRDYLKGRVEILEEYEDKTCHAGRMSFQMPAVVRFLKKVVAGMFRRRVKFNRKNVWVRDGGKCQYCGVKISLNDFTYDHVIPQRAGGPTSWENIVCACVRCNQKKGGRTLAESGMRLMKAPVVPKTLPAADITKLWGNDFPSVWKDYVATVMYWDGAMA
jgi:5-methylcytosine-specific restriction endonuclease McrA